MKNLTLAIFFFAFNVAYAQVEKTVAVTAGGLYGALTHDELHTVTYLTVTGAIDARDFKIMRDSMPVLAYIDLVGATISSYSGANGTDSTIVYYPANELPQRAFNKFAKYNKTLISVTIPSTTTSIDTGAFRDCPNLSSVVLSTTLTVINDNAFQGCSSLTSVNLPNSLAKIGRLAFLRTGLTSVYIYNSVTYIDLYAFSTCPNLKTITVESSNAAYCSYNGALFNKAMTTFIQYPAGSTIENFIVPSTVNTINYESFARCEKNPVSITIPASVTTIKPWAFAYNKSLKSIIMLNPTPLTGSAMGEDVFKYINTSCILCVPNGSKTAYQTALQWQNFTTIIDATTLSRSTITLSPDKQSSASVSVMSNKSWTISSNQSWLSISVNSGSTGATDLVLSATTANTSESPRTATVTVSATGDPDRTITVTQKAIPSVTWNNPADIYEGIALSKTQLNASSPVPGTFVYSPASGTKLDIGNNQDLTVTFTPADTSIYIIVKDTVYINVTYIQSICMVRYDFSEKRNMIVWEREPGHKTKYYKILRQATTTKYDTIGTVPYNAPFTYFIDSATNPDVQSMKYKICTVDSLNRRSPASPYHKTINLSQTKGSLDNQVVLSWNEYEDSSKIFIPSNYKIYRDNSTGTFALYTTQSAGSFFYTVNVNYVVPNEKFQIVVDKDPSCNPSLPFKAEIGPYAQSLSNIVEFKGMRLETGNIMFSVFPNPANDVVTIYTDSRGIVTMTDISGRMIEQVNITSDETKIDVSGLSDGCYFISIQSEKSIVTKKLVVCRTAK